MATDPDIRRAYIAGLRVLARFLTPLPGGRCAGAAEDAFPSEPAQALVHRRSASKAR